MIFGILLWLYFLFSSVAQSCPALCDPTDCSTPGFPVHHQLPELAQTHVHWVGDAVQQSHPLLSPSPPAFNLSQHQGIFQWVSSSHQVARVLEFQLQHQHISCYSPFMLHKCRILTVLGIHGSGLMLLCLGTCSALCILCALEYPFPPPPSNIYWIMFILPSADGLLQKSAPDYCPNRIQSSWIILLLSWIRKEKLFLSSVFSINK